MNQPMPHSKQLLIKHLQGKIRKAETTGRNDDGTLVSSGSVDMDAMLPGGGYHRGTIVQWLTDRGSGAEYLSLLAAKNAAHDGGAIVIIDHRGEFFPPAAKAMGINLGNLILLKGNGQSFSNSRLHETGPKRLKRNIGAASEETSLPASRDRPSAKMELALDDEDFLWAIDQSLRCPAVAAVWGQLPEFKTPFLAERWSRRFQLSAESSGCLGLFIAPLKTTGYQNSSRNSFSNHACWSEVQWHLRPQPSIAPTFAETHRSQKKRDEFRSSPSRKAPSPFAGKAGSAWGSSENTRTVRALLARCRGGTAGRAIDLEINLVTGNVQCARSEHATKRIRPSHPLSVASQLAHPKTDRRAERA